MSVNLQKQEHLLHRISSRIRQSLELQEILSTAVHEIRTLLHIDRAKIYRFKPDGSGEVIAESIRGKRLPSLLGLHFPADDIPPQARQLFLKARQRVIIDVAAQRKISSKLDHIDTREPLTVKDIRYTTADPCHVEYLLGMGVLSSLILPILHQNQLWGLFAIHHSQPRQFSERELQIVQLLVDQVSIAIAQSNLLNQVQQQAQYELIVNRISSLLHSPLAINEIRQSVLEETIKALGGSSGRLYLFSESVNAHAQLYTAGDSFTSDMLEESDRWKHLMDSYDNPTSLFPTHAEVVTAWEHAGRSLLPTDLPDHPGTPNTRGIPEPKLLDFTEDTDWPDWLGADPNGPIRTALIVPLQYHHQCVGWLTVFRNGYDSEILWAGRQNFDERNQLPRRSFEAWREIKTNQSQPWRQDEVNLAQAIGIHLYMATMQKRVETMLRHEALHDRLTDLPNRLLFDEQLSLALLNTQQQGEILAVAFLDLDRFKTVNDTLGHALGDLLLKQVTQRLQKCLRKGDVVARWGGDEFTLLFPKINHIEEVGKIARRILEVLSAPFFLEGQELYASASLGVTLFPYDGKDAASLLKNADTAMYRAKQQGRNNYQLYSPEMNTKAREQLELETDLRKALIRKELLLYYQPQVDIKTGEIVSLEALLRWQHPQLGLVPPSQFIPLAEETGLICPIGEWVIRTACEQHQAWLAEGLAPVRIAVNLSARQFQQQDLVKSIVHILQETHLTPSYLEIEITESVAMQDVEFTVKVLQQLRDMGVQIAMDDFGTGYSSLNSIKHFPLHTLKIDQSFVRDLLTDPSDMAIAKAVIALGQGLNLKILAEGIETAEQLEFLRSLGCAFAQGYFFSKPLPAEAIAQVLKHAQYAYADRANQAVASRLPHPTSEEAIASSTQTLKQEISQLMQRTQALEDIIRHQEQQIAKHEQIELFLRQQLQPQESAPFQAGT
ncbi:bifunctional diguanylate cyclase/phosphodiesterase [Leptolyngbya sp. AN02str]|uniref:bifunctional diguanylate cyclase/phosphodiesterase n=1 Tax=Leptolyngbya sp. AN02str TaxID=3423363 RepID=UPI003D31A4B5